MLLEIGSGKARNKTQITEQKQVKMNAGELDALTNTRRKKAIITCNNFHALTSDDDEQDSDSECDNDENKSKTTQDDNDSQIDNNSERHRFNKRRKQRRRHNLMAQLCTSGYTMGAQQMQNLQCTNGDARFGMASENDTHTNTCCTNGTHHDRNNEDMRDNIIINMTHNHNNHCILQCGSNHTQGMLNCTGPHSSRRATIACSFDHHNCHGHSTQCPCNWSKSSGLLVVTAHASERVTPHEWQVDGDESVGSETLQERSPTPKLIGHAGVWGVSREALHTRKCRLAAPNIGTCPTSNVMARDARLHFGPVTQTPYSGQITEDRVQKTSRPVIRNQFQLVSGQPQPKRSKNQRCCANPISPGGAATHTTVVTESSGWMPVRGCDGFGWIRLQDSIAISGMRIVDGEGG